MLHTYILIQNHFFRSLASSAALPVEPALVVRARVLALMYCVLVGRIRDPADEEFLGCFRKVAIEALLNHGRSISDQAKLKEAREAWDQACCFATLCLECRVCGDVVL